MVTVPTINDSSASVALDYGDLQATLVGTPVFSFRSSTIVIT